LFFSSVAKTGEFKSSFRNDVGDGSANTNTPSMMLGQELEILSWCHQLKINKESIKAA
jgi:hypothetical protein